MKILSKFLPKNFFCYFNLYQGALTVSIFMTCVMVCCCIALCVTTIRVDNVKKCDACPDYSWRNVFSLNVTATIYCFIMLFVNIWFIWGVKNNKSSVILSWSVITGTWLAQTFCLLIVLICMYSAEVNFAAWLMSLIFGLIAIGLLLYCLLAVLSYWMELKTLAHQTSAAT